jgi:hypothetical protein
MFKKKALHKASNTKEKDYRHFQSMMLLRFEANMLAEKSRISTFRFGCLLLTSGVNTLRPGFCDA